MYKNKYYSVCVGACSGDCSTGFVCNSSGVVWSRSDCIVSHSNGTDVCCRGVADVSSNFGGSGDGNGPDDVCAGSKYGDGYNDFCNSSVVNGGSFDIV